jgi:type VI secretion system secreted protein VgrG
MPQCGWTRQSENIELIPHTEQFNRVLINARYWDEKSSVDLDFSRTNMEGE